MIFVIDVDIIGEMLTVRSTVCDPPEEKNRVMVTLKMDRLIIDFVLCASYFYCPCIIMST